MAPCFKIKMLTSWFTTTWCKNILKTVGHKVSTWCFYIKVLHYRYVWWRYFEIGTMPIQVLLLTDLGVDNSSRMIHTQVQLLKMLCPNIPTCDTTVLLLFIPMVDSFCSPSYAGFHPCKVAEAGHGHCVLRIGLWRFRQGSEKQPQAGEVASRSNATYPSENEHVAWKGTISEKNIANIVFKPLFLQIWYIYI